MERKKLIQELENIKEEFKILSMRELKNESTKFLSTKKYQVVLNNGNILVREKLLKGGSDGSAAIIVPILENGNSIVIVEPRVFSETGIGIEVPAGYIEEGENPNEAARRELLEETGYLSDEIIELKSYYQDQGISGAKNRCFIALNCRKVKDQDLDKDEYIKYLECSFNNLVYLVDEGIINDANGIIAINEAKKYLRSKK